MGGLSLNSHNRTRCVTSGCVIYCACVCVDHWKAWLAATVDCGCQSTTYSSKMLSHIGPLNLTVIRQRSWLKHQRHLWGRLKIFFCQCAPSSHHPRAATWVTFCALSSHSNSIEFFHFKNISRFPDPLAESTTSTFKLWSFDDKSL